MLIHAIWLVAGIALLLFAGDALVRGAVASAIRMGVSPLVAGIIIIGFGTSLPEMLVSLEAGVSGAFDLAHGNIVGSNIANLWLVLAVPALVSPVTTGAPGLTRSMFVTVLATVVWILVTRFYGLDPIVGAIFLISLVAYVLFVLLESRKEVAAGTGQIPDVDELSEEVGDINMPVWKMVLYILIGLVGLALGARITIDAGVNIATDLGVSQSLIGLTLLAVGTSLPEIGAALAAAFRKQGDLALGNVIGSNLFNILGAGGMVAIVGSQQLAPGFHTYSHWFLALATALIVLIVLGKRSIGRILGLVFLVLYVLYILGLVAGVDFLTLHHLFIVA